MSAPDTDDNEEGEEGTPGIQRAIEVLGVRANCHQDTDKQEIQIRYSPKLLKKCSIINKILGGEI